MLSKSEILHNVRLDEAGWYSHESKVVNFYKAIDAMDEYAKNVAIEYAHWVLMRSHPSITTDDATKESKEELYDIFIHSLNNKSNVSESNTAASTEANSNNDNY